MSTPQNPDLYSAETVRIAAKFGNALLDADGNDPKPVINWVCAKCGTGRQYLDPSCGKCRSKKVRRP